MYNVKIISLETPFTYEFDRMLCVSCMSYIITQHLVKVSLKKRIRPCMLCVSCMSYIITLTFGQSSIVEVDPLT